MNRAVATFDDDREAVIATGYEPDEALAAGPGP